MFEKETLLYIYNFWVRLEPDISSDWHVLSHQPLTSAWCRVPRDVQHSAPYGTFSASDLKYSVAEYEIRSCIISDLFRINDRREKCLLTCPHTLISS